MILCHCLCACKKVGNSAESEFEFEFEMELEGWSHSPLDPGADPCCYHLLLFFSTL